MPDVGTPVRESLISAIKTALEGIGIDLTESTGYTTPKPTVFRHGDATGEAGARPAVRILWGGDTMRDQGFAPGELAVTETVVLRVHPRYLPGTVRDEVLSQTGHEVLYALTNMSYEALGDEARLQSWDSTPSTFDAPEDPDPYLDVTLTYTFSIVKEDPQTVAG